MNLSNDLSNCGIGFGTLANKHKSAPRNLLSKSDQQPPPNKKNTDQYPLPLAPMTAA